jgi:hypothetical protein
MSCTSFPSSFSSELAKPYKHMYTYASRSRFVRRASRRGSAMVAYVRHAFVNGVGKIGARSPFRAPARATRNEARIATWLVTRCATFSTIFHNVSEGIARSRQGIQWQRDTLLAPRSIHRPRGEIVEKCRNPGTVNLRCSAPRRDADVPWRSDRRDTCGGTDGNGGRPADLSFPDSSSKIDPRLPRTRGGREAVL